jgi:hypothetical protein
MKKAVFAVFVLLVLASVTHAQTVTVPQPTTYAVVLSWNAPTGCVAATPCTYAVYRVPGTVTITGGLAGATLVTTTTSQVVTVTDQTVASGQTYSYAVETLQGGANSAPSSTVTMTLPLVPSAPTGLSGSVVP